MQLLETTFVHRILETLNWTRHHPHEEGKTTEPGSRRTAETAQLNGTAGGHRHPANRNLQEKAAAIYPGKFGKNGRCREDLVDNKTSRVPSGPYRALFEAKTAIFKVPLPGFDFHGGFGRPILPNKGPRPERHEGTFADYLPLGFLAKLAPVQPPLRAAQDVGGGGPTCEPPPLHKGRRRLSQRPRVRRWRRVRGS